jgi:hypothetical protein
MQVARRSWQALLQRTHRLFVFLLAPSAASALLAQIFWQSSAISVHVRAGRCDGC